ITDTRSSLVRVDAASSGSFYSQAMIAGDIYAAAGNGTAGFSGDGGPATAAELNLPGGASADSAGNLVIADTGNDRVRVVAARTAHGRGGGGAPRPGPPRGAGVARRSHLHHRR